MNKYSIKSFFRIPVVIGICLPILFSGCGGGVGNGGKDGEKKGLPALPVIMVTAGDATVSTEYSSLLEGKVNVEIRPQVDGTLAADFRSRTLRLSASDGVPTVSAGSADN